MNRALRIVVADDEPDTCTFHRLALARLGHQVLGEAHDGRALVELGGRLRPDLIITDVMMPELDGVEASIQLNHDRPVPVILLSGCRDAQLIERAGGEHIMAYLVKPIKEDDLGPAIAVAMRRFHEIQTLRELSLTDELTGLHNRRGFTTLADQQLKMARRYHKAVWLLMIDIDGLKQINDTFGHREGDQAIRDTAALLRQTFRASDLVARLGGDEFCVMAVDAPDHPTASAAMRLQENLHRHQTESAGHPFRLSFSIGTVRLDPASDASVSRSLADADALLYEHKRRRKHSMAHAAS